MDMEVDVKKDTLVDNGWMNKEIDKEKVEKWAPAWQELLELQELLEVNPAGIMRRWWGSGGASDRRLFAADP